AVFRRRPAAGFWRRTFVRHGWLFVIHLFLTVPLLLGFLLSRAPRTRRDEAAYRGPRLPADGTWRLQSRESLAAEAAGREHVDPAVQEAASQRTVTFSAQDGAQLRASLVAP